MANDAPLRILLRYICNSENIGGRSYTDFDLSCPNRTGTKCRTLLVPAAATSWVTLKTPMPRPSGRKGPDRRSRRDKPEAVPHTGRRMPSALRSRRRPSSQTAWSGRHWTYQDNALQPLIGKDEIMYQSKASCPCKGIRLMPAQARINANVQIIANPDTGNFINPFAADFSFQFAHSSTLRLSIQVIAGRTGCPEESVQTSVSLCVE